MSTYYTHPNPNAPAEDLMSTGGRPRKKRSWIRKTIIPAAALLLGIGMGAAGAGTPQPQPASAPAPAPTVTQTVETPGPVQTERVEVPGPVQTKTVKVPGPEVVRVPASCTTALDLADEGFTVSSEILKAIQDSIASGDFSGAEAGNAKLNALAPRYNATKAACRAAAEPKS
jgi:hypothetical protein